MAKQLVAVTNVKHDGIEYASGSVLDPKVFTKEQLRALYDNGAVAVEDVAEVAAPEAEEVPIVPEEEAAAPVVESETSVV